MNSNLFNKVLILTKSMITRKNYQKPLKNLNEFERNFNQENLILG